MVSDRWLGMVGSHSPRSVGMGCTNGGAFASKFLEIGSNLACISIFCFLTLIVCFLSVASNEIANSLSIASCLVVLLILSCWHNHSRSSYDEHYEYSPKQKGNMSTA